MVNTQQHHYLIQFHVKNLFDSFASHSLASGISFYAFFMITSKYRVMFVMSQLRQKTSFNLSIYFSLFFSPKK